MSTTLSETRQFTVHVQVYTPCTTLILNMEEPCGTLPVLSRGLEGPYPS